MKPTCEPSDPSEYDLFLAWAQRRHEGSLQAALRAEQEHAASRLEGRMTSAAYWAYLGPEVAPFALYMRWQRGRVTVASIAGKGQKSGRLTPLCAALEATGLIVRWEAVGNAALRAALRRRGYLQSHPEPVFSADLIKPPA